MERRVSQVILVSEPNENDRFSHLEKVFLPQNETAVQVACGQHFSLCLTSNGKVVIWGSLSGKTDHGDGFFYQKPE